MSQRTGTTLFVCSVLWIGFAAVASAQTTYDLADYWLLKPGAWKIETLRTPGSTSTLRREAYVVTTAGPYIVQNTFRWNGSAWQPSDMLFFQKTATELLAHGSFDPLSGHLQQFSPPIKIPRKMQVNQPYTSTGMMITPTGSTPYVCTFMITADHITINTKSGKYVDCLRVQQATIADKVTSMSSDVRARNVGAVHWSHCTVDETRVETKMVSAFIAETTDPKTPTP
jgi:hypothetical protein